MKKLILIDGNAILHRAYHALPPLTNSKGEMVNAVYGFFSMLLTILIEQKPTHLAICFDRSKPTVRQSMYAGYHEHRPPADGELISQIDILDDLLSKMGVQTYSLEGYEADDIIGTFAKQAVSSQKAQNTQLVRKSDTQKVRESDVSEFQRLQNTEFSESSENIEILIVTGDRDLLQLVNDKVKVLMTVTGITKTVLYDKKLVEEKYGISPSQFVDFKALIGDPSDGYPGITGIGPKTASSLLQKYGTFEDLYQNIDSLPEKISLKLATDAEQGALAKKLATIITDAPIKLSLEDCETARFDMKALMAGFEEQGFKSLRERAKKLTDNYKENEQLGLL